MGLAPPGIFSGNVLYQPIFEGREEGFGGAVKATVEHLAGNMMIAKNIFGLRPSGSPSETSETPYDDFVEGVLNTFGVKGEGNIERRRLFFEARHTRAMRQLNQMLANKALPLHVRMEIKELMDEVQANYNATPLGRRGPTAETMFPGQGTF